MRRLTRTRPRVLSRGYICDIDEGANEELKEGREEEANERSPDHHLVALTRPRAAAYLSEEQEQEQNANQKQEDYEDKSTVLKNTRRLEA